MNKTYKIEITLTNSKKIRLELDTQYAPKTVEHFVNLVKQNYFDGTIFHRIIENFMIQTGGYLVEGNEIHVKEEKETIKGEFNANGFENNLRHVPGVISMARTSDMNSASAQFFICSSFCPHLDGQYAAFGKTTDEESLETVMRISEAPTVNVGGGLTDFPYPVIYIQTIEKIK